MFLLFLSTITYGCETRSSDPSTAGAGGTESPSSKTATVEHQRVDDKATDELQARRVEETKLQASFDVSDRRLGTLTEKAGTLTGANKQDANDAAAVAKTNEATVIASIAKMRDATLTQWDAAKAQVVSDADAFGKSVDALEKTTAR